MSIRVLVAFLAIIASTCIAAGADAATYQRMAILPQTVTVQANDTEEIASLCLDSNRAPPGPGDAYSAAYASLDDVEVKFGDQKMTLGQALGASPPLAAISGSDEESPNKLQIENRDPQGRPMTLTVRRHFVLAAGDDTVGDVIPYVEAHRGVWSSWAPVGVKDTEKLQYRNEIVWSERYTEAAADLQKWLPELADSLSVDDTLTLTNLKAVQADLASKPRSDAIAFVLIDRINDIVGVAVRNGKPSLLHRGKVAAEISALQSSPRDPLPLFLVGNSVSRKKLPVLGGRSGDDFQRYAAKALQIDLVVQAVSANVPVPAMPNTGPFATNLLGDVAKSELLQTIRVEQTPPPATEAPSEDPDAWKPLPAPIAQAGGPPGGAPPPPQPSAGPENPRGWRFWIVAKSGAKTVWSRARDWLVVTRGSSAVAASAYLSSRLEGARPQPDTLRGALQTYNEAVDGMSSFLDSRDGSNRELTTNVTFWRRQLVGMNRADNNPLEATRFAWSVGH